MIIGSVAISYILKALTHSLHMCVLSDINFDWYNKVLILSIFALTLSLCSVYISERKWINKIPLLVNHKSLHEDIWSDILDYKNGTSLRIVCQDAIYTGTLVGHEEKGIDSWFILTNYIIEENNTIQNSENITYKSILAINLRNVKRIELYYGEVQKSKALLYVEKINQKMKTRLKS